MIIVYLYEIHKNSIKSLLISFRSLTEHVSAFQEKMFFCKFSQVRKCYLCSKNKKSAS